MRNINHITYYIVADLYILLFDATTTHPLAHGRSGFYFGENGEHTLYSISQTIAQILFEMGKGRSPVPTTFNEEETRRYFPGGTSLGSNSRCRAERSREVGWRPRKGTEDMLRSIGPEVQALVKTLDI
jgi:hypothetical protein